MTTLEVGKELVSLTRGGKPIYKLYAEDVTSIEAAEWAGFPREMRGLEAVREKVQWWAENNEVHSLEVEGPLPNGDQFIVLFRLDATQKPTGARMSITSAGLYTVAKGKVVREEFFYEMG